MGTLITLRSSDGTLLTIIDSASNAIELALNDNAVVTIDGFTITGATSTTTDNGDGIFVYDNDGGDLEDVNVTISNNIITGNEGNGILFGNVIAGNAQVTIEGNIISNNGFGGGLFSEGEGAEIEVSLILPDDFGNGIFFVAGIGSADISYNTISENANNGVCVMHTKDNFDGPYVENDAQLMTDMIQGGLPTVSPCNDIYDNLNYGVLNSSVLVLNEDGIISVDATRNWWGDASGPSGVGPGTGDEVSDNVDYKPWLRAPCGFVTCIPPQADFTAQPTRGTAPLNVEFTDESTGTISQWQWDFGDGNTSDEQNPTHRYLRPGRYTVTLEVSSGCGADIETKQNYIFVLGVAEEAELAKLTTTRIDVRPTEVVPNQQVQISVNVVNNGDTRVSDSVDLYINGYQEDSRSVGVSPGASQTVTFTVAKATPGTYEVVVGINRGWFTVIGNSNSSNPGTATGGGGPGTVGLIAIIVAAVGAGLGIFFATRAREA